MNDRMAISQIGGVALDRAMSDAEAKLRVEMAAAFRIAQHLRWNLDTLNHITLRIPGTDTFLMNPLGLAWEEITASSLATARLRPQRPQPFRRAARARRLQLPQRHSQGAARTSIASSTPTSRRASC